MTKIFKTLTGSYFMPTDSTYLLTWAIKYKTKGCKILFQMYIELTIKKTQNNYILSSQKTNQIIGA